MEYHRVFIGIGSNIDPEENIRKSLVLLAARVRVANLSRFYRTAPVGPPGQPPFVNGAVLIETEWDARPLKFEVLRDIEARLGRVRSDDRYAPRPIDLDILLFDRAIIRDSDLCVPDPDIWDRPFLAAALLDLDPGLELPDRRQPLRHAPCLSSSDAPPMEPLSLELKKAFCHE